MITCQEVVEYLMAYVIDELSPAERSAMDEHLKVCPECVTFLKNYEQTLRCEALAFQNLDPMAPEAVPEGLIQAILAAQKQSNRLAPQDEDRVGKDISGDT